jgi:hypothetical protein
MTLFHRTFNIVARGQPDAHGVGLMKGREVVVLLM